MNILDIFYKNIITEAKIGRVNSYFYYNIIFSTKIIEENIEYKSISDIDVTIPSLIIRNKKEFDKLLIEYVNLCMEFYDDSNFDDSILNYKEYDEVNRICKEKTILTLLFANATIEDFENPIDFLKRRIAFIKETSITDFNLGYSELLKSNLNVEIRKDKIHNETPYQFILKGTLENGEEYIFPQVKFGISENKAYIYAIQNSMDNKNESKKIKRLLYKIGEGFSKDEDNFSIYDTGNLNDITASFLVVANVCMAYFEKIGIKEIVVSSILIERWNSKKIANNLKYSKNKISKEELEEQNINQELLQSNLTEKFLRTFLRLNHHYENLNIISYPFDIDSYMHINVSNATCCNNKLLLETNIMMKESIEKTSGHSK